MRRLTCLIPLLSLCLYASAQKGDNFEDLKKGWIKTHALLLVHSWNLKDTLSKEQLIALKSKDVSSFDVLKPVDAVSIFGEKGRGGAVVFNIDPGVPGNEDIDKRLAEASIYVIDGMPAQNKLEGVDAKDILSMKVLSAEEGAELFHLNFGSSFIVVTTKAGAVKNYQAKFSALSPAYKEYLATHNNDDSGLHYNIDGYDCDKGMDGLSRLNNLTKETIADIKISAKGDVTTVLITTKK